MENWIEEKDKLHKAMESMVEYKDAWYYDMLDDFFDIETEEEFKEFLLKWLHHFLEEFIPIPDGKYKITMTPEKNDKFKYLV